MPLDENKQMLSNLFWRVCILKHTGVKHVVPAKRINVMEDTVWHWHNDLLKRRHFDAQHNVAFWLELVAQHGKHLEGSLFWNVPESKGTIDAYVRKGIEVLLVLISLSCKCFNVSLTKWKPIYIPLLKESLIVRQIESKELSLKRINEHLHIPKCQV